MGRQRRGMAMFAAALAFAIVALGASPASAGQKITRFQAARAHANFSIAAFPGSGTGSGVSGYIEYFSDYPLATLLSIYIQQCDGLGHKCVTIAANQTQQLGAVTISTGGPDKKYSPGHVYKTCGSVKDTDGWRLLDVCSAPTT
jgi:hypothetical protein